MFQANSCFYITCTLPTEGKFDYLEFTRTLKHGAKEKDEEGQIQGEEVTAEDKGHVEEGAEGVQCWWDDDVFKINRFYFITLISLYKKFCIWKARLLK